MQKHLYTIVLYVTLGLFAQSQELPPFENFAPKDYQAQNQNWSITQDHENVIYFANNAGLLEFNGAKWTTYPSPNQTIMRSVLALGKRIYTGCYMEFGYWERSQRGQLQYQSISEELKIELIEDEEIWHIIDYKNFILFQSLQRIYLYSLEDGSVKKIDAQNEIIKIFKVDESVFYQDRGFGLFKFHDEGPSLLSDHVLVLKNEVVGIFSDAKDLLIVTSSSGIYQLSQKEVVPWNKANKHLRNLQVYSTLQTAEGSLILGTISHGILDISDQGDLRQNYSQENSLANNTVLSLFQDADENIWSGLDNGITLINRNAPIRIFRDAE
ncbi:MAG: hypothetical protein AAF616_15545, partial [Bacteroidota bacterium]